MSTTDRSVSVIDVEGDHPSLPIVHGDGIARALVWPGMGARSRSMHWITLQPSARTIPLVHPMEAVYYVMSGNASLFDRDAGTTHEAVMGSMILIEPRTTYAIAAQGETVEVVGGPCPPDPELYRHLTKQIPEPTAEGR